MAILENIDLDEYLMDLHEISHTIVNSKSIEVAAYYPYDDSTQPIFFVMLGVVEQGFTFIVENSIHPTIEDHRAFTELSEALKFAADMVQAESLKV